MAGLRYMVRPLKRSEERAEADGAFITGVQGENKSEKKKNEFYGKFMPVKTVPVSDQALEYFDPGGGENGIQDAAI